MSIHVWQSDLYDEKLDFVSRFGKDMIDLLAPVNGEKILDLGCGTGELAYEISKNDVTVIGIDKSPQMINTARQKFSKINFIVGDAENFVLEEQVDAVFSNAALHWMKNPEKVIKCVWDALKPNGRFIAEFGGKDNVKAVINATSKVLDEEYGIDVSEVNPWYFPSIAEYSGLLEKQGFRVIYAVLFERPTKMKDDENGLKLWLTGLADDLFGNLTVQEKENAIRKIEADAQKDLYKDGAWYIDYVRIRLKAVKHPY